MRRPRRRPWTIVSRPCLRRELRWSTSRHVPSRIHPQLLHSRRGTSESEATSSAKNFSPSVCFSGGGRLHGQPDPPLHVAGYFPRPRLDVDDEGAVIGVVVPRLEPAAPLDPPPVFFPEQEVVRPASQALTLARPRDPPPLTPRPPSSRPPCPLRAVAARSAAHPPLPHRRAQNLLLSIPREVQVGVEVADDEGD